MRLSLNFNRMKQDLIEESIDYCLGKVDKFIDTPEEREALADKVILYIEDKIGRDIPGMNETEERDVVKYILVNTDTFLKRAIKMDLL